MNWARCRPRPDGHSAHARSTPAAPLKPPQHQTLGLVSSDPLRQDLFRTIAQERQGAHERVTRSPNDPSALESHRTGDWSASTQRVSMHTLQRMRVLEVWLAPPPRVLSRGSPRRLRLQGFAFLWADPTGCRTIGLPSSYPAVPSNSERAQLGACG